MQREYWYEFLPYLKWIDMFSEEQFIKIFRIPISTEDQLLTQNSLDVGYLYWYISKRKKMERMTFCMKQQPFIQPPTIRSPLGELLHQVNTTDEFIPWYYLYRIKNNKIRDAIRINLECHIDKTILLTRGFHLSQGYMCHKDELNLQQIQTQLNENVQLRLVTPIAKHITRLHLYNPIFESKIIIKGTIPSELVEICKKYGYNSKTKSSIQGSK